MTSVGDISLREEFKDSIQMEQVISGILNFTRIQRYLEKSINELLEIGTLDWRLNTFPSLYLQLIEQDKLLIKDGLDNQEIDRLHNLYNTCTNLCDELSSYEIPETINHCDFHENNMILDINSGVISIIDWGETVISHPFFSLNGCLWNITYFYPIKEYSKSYKLLSANCVAAWQDLYDEQVLLKVLNTAKKINGIFAALSYQRMYKATRNFSNSVQNEHPGSIAGCLRTFLNTFN
ncbi:aminoglycoside phosphotransferase family protein [Legionella worsleiensis]|uniref:Phosphotransferase enzyme family protein n=1 Tax=Legionella worsleiensis TaxID=45076 RepID=A0A0W1AGU6_9GAMM|nr:aminoglycoside phosphotransferase family protein [Legionella worsleiensis]KTD80371.1 Phosphotransferase enzyme family protein [Legionella worsleiensis]STY32775.1 Phosphotransferase enzyme family [Legionella worsleiensis]